MRTLYQFTGGFYWGEREIGSLNRNAEERGKSGTRRKLKSRKKPKKRRKSNEEEVEKNEEVEV